MRISVICFDHEFLLLALYTFISMSIFCVYFHLRKAIIQHNWFVKYLQLFFCFCEMSIFSPQHLSLNVSWKSCKFFCGISYMFLHF